MSVDLTRIGLPALKVLLALVKAGRLRCPLSLAALSANGLGRWEADLDSVRGLDAPALAAVLGAIISERGERPASQVELVWTGPEARVSEARDTSVVVERLFGAAQSSALVAGYRFDHPHILEPLHQAMRERGVTAQFFLDIPGEAPDPRAAEAVAAEEIERFFAKVWVFGPPLPALFYDPHTAMGRATCLSLHAKCVVIDEQTALVTSANFTQRGHTRNIEVGALIHDPEFASALVAQWLGLVQAGHLKPWHG